MEFKKNIQDNLIDKTTSYINKLIILHDSLKSIYNIKQEKKKSSTIQFKVRSYKKWISLLNKLKNDISNEKISIDFLKTNKVSDKCIKKMIEINDTDNLKEIDELTKTISDLQQEITELHVETKTAKSKSKGSSIKNISYESAILHKVYGIGEKTVDIFLKSNITLDKFMEEWTYFVNNNNSSLIPDNYFDINDLSKVDNFNNDKNIFIKEKFSNTKYLKLLNYGQLVGIKYFNDIEQRIPRNEIKIIEKILKKCLKTMNKDLKMDICGSYRRGKEDSGDIDVLICHPNIKENEDLQNLKENILLKLVIFLTKAGFIKEHLTLKGNTKYMGLCKLNNTVFHRRIDIIFKPYNCYASSLLYFTGSGDLNKIMREHAMRKGYKLNEYGLFKTKFNKSTNKLEEEYRIDCFTEKEIFENLDYKWLKPTERNI